MAITAIILTHLARFHLTVAKDNPVYTVKEHLATVQMGPIYIIFVPLQCRLICLYVKNGVSVFVHICKDSCCAYSYSYGEQLYMMISWLASTSESSSQLVYIYIYIYLSKSNALQAPHHASSIFILIKWHLLQCGVCMSHTQHACLIKTGTACRLCSCEVSFKQKWCVFLDENTYLSS